MIMSKLVAGFLVTTTLAGCYDPADNCLYKRSNLLKALFASQSFVEETLPVTAIKTFPELSELNVNVFYNDGQPCTFNVSSYVDIKNGYNGYGRTDRMSYLIIMKVNPETGEWSSGWLRFSHNVE